MIFKTMFSIYSKLSGMLERGLELTEIQEKKRIETDLGMIIMLELPICEITIFTK